MFLVTKWLVKTNTGLILLKYIITLSFFTAYIRQAISIFNNLYYNSGFIKYLLKNIIRKTWFVGTNLLNTY